MIHSSEISKSAHQLGLGDRTIEKDYVLTWVLHAIANSPLRNQLAFKGGTAIKKIYIPGYRFSEDLDFTLLDLGMTNEMLESKIATLFQWLRENANLTLEIRKIDVHASGDPAFYLNYVGPLQGQIASRFLKVDFTRAEVLAFPLRDLPVRSPYSDLQAREARLQVYSLEEILAEKLRSLLTRAEPRDLYDIHYLLDHQMVDVEEMKFSMTEKFTAKGFVVSDLNAVLEKREKVFQRLWESRLNGQMPDIPALDTVIRETNRFLQQHF